MNLFQIFYRSKPGTHRIRYVVKGDAEDYNVTFKCSEGCRVVQEPHVNNGWKHTFVGNVGDYIYVSAQSNQAGSEVNLMVYEDGKLVESLSKRGDYPLVQISATVH